MKTKLKICKSKVRSPDGFWYAIADRFFKSVIFYDEELSSWFITNIMRNFDREFILESMVMENVERPVHNKSDKEQKLDMLLLLNDYHLVNVEANSEYRNETHIKNYIYYASLYSELVKRSEKLDSQYELVSIDITSGLPSDYESVSIEKFYLQSDRQIRYIQNTVKMVYNLDKIMESWYNRDKKEIERYYYIMMLKMDEAELEELIGYVSEENKKYLKAFRERLL